MTVVHHLYQFSADLLPVCGVAPGPDLENRCWHTGDEARVLLVHADQGHDCCQLCVRLARREPSSAHRPI